MSLETMSAAISRLAQAGYSGSFSATDDGGLRCTGCEGWHAPRDAGIDEIVRFEGNSDPADEAAVFALSCGHCGAKGTYVVTYGPEMGSADAEVVKGLLDHRRE